LCCSDALLPYFHPFPPASCVPSSVMSFPIYGSLPAGTY
jgi:hypothetical protein